MQVHTAQPGGLLQYIIPFAIVILVLFFRVRRMSRMQPLKLERLWIVPAIYLVVVIGIFATRLPTVTGWLVSFAALLFGAALGWQRGKTMQIHIDPETHALNQKASVAGIAFLLVLVAVKTAAQTGGQALHLNVALLSDALAALALGMFSMTRLEMYLRGKRMLEAARARRA